MHDKRSYELNLTGQGQKMYAAIVPAANARYQKIISALEREELLISALERQELPEFAEKLNRLLARTEELGG